MRFVVVGCGNIGAKRIEVLGERCVGTVDPYHPAARYPTLPECPLEGYDAAVLAVPNPIKLELLEFLLEHGKHALVEKPLVFPNRDIADRLHRKARQCEAVWYTAYNLRFEPNVVALKQFIADGTIGEIYRARLFYGYGTSARVAHTWRDSPLGVLEDLASHLVDLTGFVFGRSGEEFLVWQRCAHELSGVDHCILATIDRRIVLECSLLSWKNRWSIEVAGARGALHVEGLTKWGRSDLVVQRRRFPSGPPEEFRTVVTDPDPTWGADVRYFERMVARGETSYDNDVWVSRTLLRAAELPLA